MKSFYAENNKKSEKKELKKWKLTVDSTESVCTTFMSYAFNNYPFNGRQSSAKRPTDSEKIKEHLIIHLNDSILSNRI